MRQAKTGSDLGDIALDWLAMVVSLPEADVKLQKTERPELRDAKECEERNCLKRPMKAHS